MWTAVAFALALCLTGIKVMSVFNAVWNSKNEDFGTVKWFLACAAWGMYYYLSNYGWYIGPC